MTGVNYERELNMPLGGVTKALADATLDNTSQRYTPDYMGGNGELYTAILPRRPMIINAGFDLDGIVDVLPQFVGITTELPKLSRKSGQAAIKGADFVDFLQNRFLDDTLMFTAQRTDQVIQTLLTDLGFATAQYDLDYGINQIPFGIFDPGARFSDIIDKLVQAENGHFYQDEEGVLRFENRQHWDSYPYYNVQQILPTAQVLDANLDGIDHIVNVVEVNAKVRTKQPKQLIWQSSSTIELAAGATIELFADFQDPVLAADDPNVVASTASSGGTDVSSSIGLTYFYTFARSAKMRLQNNTSATAFITNIAINGRPAQITSELYYREQRDLSVTAYEEHPIKIDNDYIQSQDWARSYAGLILRDFSQPENLIRLTIRALPQLSMGDLISWQGRYWRVYGIKTKISQTEGFLQELELLQRTIVTYFRIGISTIGGSDLIAP